MNIVPYYIILCIVMSTVWRGTKGQTGADAKALRKKVFIADDYDKKIRPTIDHNDATEVWVSFYLLSINALDEVTETLKTTGYLVIEWYDHFLRWNASDHAGIDYYHWPQDDVWKPDVALKNSYLDYKQLGVSTLNVLVTSDGYVTWSPFQVFQSTCSVDITHFPFDTQTCKLKFVAWSYTKDEVIMVGGSEGINLDDYETNSEWDVINSTQTVQWESDEAAIVYSLIMKRKPRYHLLTVVLPIVMLTILNLFVFVLPCDSGEKASYGVTVFLAFAVFLTIVSTKMPENSESTATFSIYVIIQTVQSTVITLVALLLLRLNSLSDARPVPACLIAVLRMARCEPCRRRSKTTIQVAPTDLDAEKGKKDVMKSTRAGDRRPYTWKDAVNGLDFICLILFSIVAIISTVVSLTVAAMSD